MKKRSEGSVRKSPLYVFDRIKNRKVQAKSGHATVEEISLVESMAELIADIVLKEELEFKYAGIASARKGETKTAPKTRGISQKMTCFLEVPKFLGETITTATVTTVVATKTAALKE